MNTKNETLGLLARLEARPGKEAELEALLRNGVLSIEDEPATISWFAIKMSSTVFGIFDTFADENGRREHLSAKFASTLMEQAPDILAHPPQIEAVDIVARKRA